MSYRLPDADGIVFDFNGTLFPDERENRESWNVIAVMLRGRELSDEEFRLQNGRTDEEMIRFLLPSADEKETEGWIAEIQRIFPGMEVMCDDLSLGVSCHTGPGALGIGCSVCPAGRSRRARSRT